MIDDLPTDERARLGTALALNMILHLLVHDLAAALRRERAGERDEFFTEEVLDAVLALLDETGPDPLALPHLERLAGWQSGGRRQ